jgi:predicted nuclease of predicted toxin-antitoxin system
VRLLVDNALSPSLARALRECGHDAVHVRDRELQSADDAIVLEFAVRERRVVVSADTDFGTLLALRGDRAPSVILFRRGMERRPSKQLSFLLDHMVVIEAAADRGAIVVLEDSRVRVRCLPIDGEGPGGRDGDFVIRDRAFGWAWSDADGRGRAATGFALRCGSQSSRGSIYCPV